ncbi:MAG: hypothetical protein O3B01_08270 [Planctomycetota bacterium]|nr:hypothetical protein [Planctomycetota bacterium]
MRKRLPKVELMEDEMYELLRQKTPMETNLIADRMWKDTRVMILNFVSKEFPDWEQEKIEKEVARRMLNGAT